MKPAAAALATLLAVGSLPAAANPYLYEGFPPSTWDLYEPHEMTTPHPFSHGCCHERDCLYAKPGAVQWTPQGFRVTLPDGRFEFLAENDSKLKQYPPTHADEKRFAPCFAYRSPQTMQYLKDNNPDALARTQGSPWYVRCLYLAGGAT